MTERTIPERSAIARAIDAVDQNHDAGSGDFASPEEYADAVLAVLADQPTIAEARAAAFDYAAAVAASTFYTGGDYRFPTFAVTADALRNLAARERGESR